MPDSATARCQTCGMHGGHKMQCPQRTDAGLRVAVDGSSLPAPAPAAGEPELPEPKWHDCSPTDAAHMPYFTAAQLRAYGQAMAEHARRAAMEEAVQAAADVDEPAWHGYECPNTFQDGVSAAIAAIRAAAPPQGEQT